VSFTRFIRFALVGGVATAIQYAILVVLVRFADLAPPVASTIGFIASAGVNYLLNYRFTFRSDRAHGAAAAKFAVLVFIGMLLNAGLMKLLVSAGWNYLIAQICVTGVVLVWNYAGNSLWTFGGKDSTPPGAAQAARSGQPD
jgi:putative flippase GtrA